MTAKPRVMLIDDDEDFLESLAGLLQSWGTVEIVTADNGVTALEQITNCGPFDLILSDYMMPDMDGLTLKEVLNEQPVTQAIPFVMISGYGTPRLLDMAAGKGIEEWYDKPVEMPVLKKLMKKYLNT
jgi:CheY-like chemotaxis protein